MFLNSDFDVLFIDGLLVQTFQDVPKLVGVSEAFPRGTNVTKIGQAKCVTDSILFFSQNLKCVIFLAFSVYN